MPIRLQLSSAGIEQCWCRAVQVLIRASRAVVVQNSAGSGQCGCRIVLVQDRASRLVLLQSSADSEQAWAYHTDAE
jgi:hypothetical protein